MNIYDRQLAVSGGTLHHIGLLLAREEAVPLQTVCAWCDQEAGVKRSPWPAVSHGICARHHAQQLALVELLHQVAA